MGASFAGVLTRAVDHNTHHQFDSQYDSTQQILHDYSSQHSLHVQHGNGLPNGPLSLSNSGFNASGLMGPDSIPITQASVAVAVLFAASVYPFLPRPPLWLRPFAQEHDDHDGRRKRCPSTYWTVSLGALTAIGLALGVVSAILPPFEPLQLFQLVPWLVSTLLTAVQRPTKTPYTLLFLYVTNGVLGLVSIELARRSLQPITWFRVSSAATSIIAILGILAMPIREPGLARDGIGGKTPTHELRSPEDNLTLWEFMTVSWMGPLISRGSKKQLNDEDVWLLPYEFQHGRLHMLFRDIHAGSMLKKILLVNGLDLVIISFLGLLESAAKLSAPLLLKKLLESIKGNGEDFSASLLWALAILGIRLVASQSSVFSLWYSRRCYERSRGEMITTIYAKTLTRKSFGQSPDSTAELDGEPGTDEPSNGDSANGHTKPPDVSKGRFARLLSFLRLRRREDQYQRLKKRHHEQKDQPATTGKILNIMKSDVYEVAQRFWDFPQFVIIPLRFAISFGLVWTLVGWSCLLGLACVVITQLFSALVIRRKIAVERVRRSATDDRLESTSQFVTGLRHLRWYDWQGKWLARVLESRQVELNLRFLSSVWGLALSALNIASAVLFPVATFSAYTYIAGNRLPVEVAFPALQLFTMMEASFRMIPDLVTVVLDAAVAMGRIERFMLEPDKDDGESDHKADKIEFDVATFAFPGRETPVLYELELKIPRGLTVVFGKVGSGKSAFLQAILGELDHFGGNFTLPNAMVGYCAQRPWLQHMNIRDNILFSAPYDPERYTRVLEACGLLPDLANFEHGDLSDMGENGIGLSGGQRARVALARAVYSQARILLLDDPIAALDQQTAEHIVRRLFQGPLMEDRTVILVTHRVDLCLHRADQMVEIEDGRARVLDAEEASREAAKFLREEEQDTGQEAVPEEVVLNQQSEAIPSKFIEEEHRATGGVMLSVYWTYIKAGTITLWIALLVGLAVSRLASLLNFWFLKSWGEAYSSMAASSESSDPLAFISHLFDVLPDPDDRLSPWLLAYLGIAIGRLVIFTLSSLLIRIMVYVSSKNLFNRVVTRVSGATFRFYDVTPVGRLMNRLLSDMGMIDGGIMSPLQNVAWSGIQWISSIIVVAGVTPTFLAFSIGMTLWFALIFNRFLPTSQSLRRLEMVSLSPLMSNFGILLEGLATIRAFKAQPHFQQQNIAVTDAFQKMDHFYWSLQAWLQYRFDALSAVSTFALTLLALSKGLSPGLTAFVLTTAGQFVESTHMLCQLYGQLQLDFVSAERVIELLDVEQEPEGDVQPPPEWPSERDDVVFDDVTIKYAEHLEPSLSNVSFSIPGGSTCAVLGRTGSGKSTLALALLATMHPVAGSGRQGGNGIANGTDASNDNDNDSNSGRDSGAGSGESECLLSPEKGVIRVGAQDLSAVNVHAWRRRISFVAQDPVLFPGTIRENLDPLHQFSDEDCAAVLGRVLGEGWSLSSRVEGGDGGGGNLSQGQRQLIGIGRAVLRRSPVVVLDEATASVDKETAAKVQDVLREELGGSTVVTIAHRVEAVRGANWLVRLDGGRVVESGPVGGEATGR